MSDQGTQGILVAAGFISRTIELPWRDNESNISCIPPGEYMCRPHHSKKFGSCYLVEKVKSRTWILIHSGNFAGDKSAGYKTHSYGCILPGKYFGMLHGQLAVLVSRATVGKFINYMNKQPFLLNIKNF